MSSGRRRVTAHTASDWPKGIWSGIDVEAEDLTEAIRVDADGDDRGLQDDD